MKLSFIGTGYVGLVSGACMAELGHTVICADIDKKKITGLNKGVMPIYELGLEELVQKNVEEGRLSFTTDIGTAVRTAEVVFNAVGTPEDQKTGEADLRYVFKVAEAFGKNLNGYKILATKSTVPVGTADQVSDIIRHANQGNQEGHEFDVVSNPEFLREGAAIKDFLNPDRVIVGVASERAKDVMKKIYRPIKRTGRPVMVTDVHSAELIKYAANAYLATKISFINEIGNFCEQVGADVREVSRGMGLDSRIGSRFLSAGIGYGGSCFPKDIQALIQTGKKHRHRFRMLETVDAFNDAQKVRPLDILRRQYKSLKNKTIAVWGLSFKPRTDDVREAPALAVITGLLKDKAKVQVFDPVAMVNFKQALPDKRIHYTDNAYAALEGADALLILTEWDEFRTVEYPEMTARMRTRLIIDGRNILERREAEADGFTYFGIGV